MFYIYINDKIKVVPLHFIQIQRGGRDLALPTLDLDLRKWRVGRERPRLLYPREIHPVPNVQETLWASGPICMS